EAASSGSASPGGGTRAGGTSRCHTSRALPASTTWAVISPQRMPRGRVWSSATRAALSSGLAVSTLPAYEGDLDISTLRPRLECPFDHLMSSRGVGRDPAARGGRPGLLRHGHRGRGVHGQLVGG